MNTKTLPDTPKKEMNQNYLVLLIRGAINTFIDFIRERPFQSETIAVYRPQASGNVYQSLTRPKLQDVLFLYQAERIQLPAVKSLMDYLWEHGGHQLTLTRDDCDPDREGWASNVFHITVVNALWRLWDECSVRSLSITGFWQPWDVSEEQVDQLANNIASIEVGNGAMVRITFPLLQVILDDEESFEFEPGVTIRNFTQGDRAIYLHKNGRVYPFDDGHRPYMCTSYIEIIANTKTVFNGDEKQAAVEDFVGYIVARVKWAILQVTDPTQLIDELPATTEIQQDIFGVFPIRRQFTQRKIAGSIKLDSIKCKSAENLLKMLSSAVGIFPDIQGAIWLFDRATLAASPRDILFESTVGLERLLVAGAGENSRRFKTYGTALLCDDDPIVTSGNLSKIYALRSGAAHGTDVDRKNFKIYSVHARTYLSKAIEKIVQLVAASKLIHKDKAQVSKAVEQYLLNHLYAAVKEDSRRFRTQ